MDYEQGKLFEQVIGKLDYLIDELEKTKKKQG